MAAIEKQLEKQIAMLLDGVTAMIEFTMEEDSGPYLIDGISQDDYFEYELLYAD